MSFLLDCSSYFPNKIMTVIFFLETVVQTASVLYLQFKIVFPEGLLLIKITVYVWYLKGHSEDLYLIIMNFDLRIMAALIPVSTVSVVSTEHAPISSFTRCYDKQSVAPKELCYICNCYCLMTNLYYENAVGVMHVIGKSTWWKDFDRRRLSFESIP